MKSTTIGVVVPNWNGLDHLQACIDSLLSQTQKHTLIIVDNNSTDGSLELLQKDYPKLTLVRNATNLGFAGGVNSGIRRAIALNCQYIALFNNDAVADARWLEHLVAVLDEHQEVGIVTCKLLSEDGSHIDSTGECYTNWGLPYPRGRKEPVSNVYDQQREVFAASGGASLYRTAMLEKIGLFDEDFFAYYEDVDISFRAQLAGWKVRYEPAAIAQHRIGATSSKVKGFVTYQTMKNEPILLFKNVPRRYLWRIGWRFFIAHCLFFLRALSRGQGWVALKGDAKGTDLLFGGFSKRKKIQQSKTVSDEYIWNMLTHDLPPNAMSLRRFRSMWWKLWGKH